MPANTSSAPFVGLHYHPVEPVGIQSFGDDPAPPGEPLFIEVPTINTPVCMVDFDGVILHLEHSVKLDVLSYPHQSDDTARVGVVHRIGIDEPSRVTDAEVIQKSRLHPLSILLASSVYGHGRGVKGSLTWTPDSAVSAALDDAFVQAFKNVEPTGKRHLIGLDVSGSMNHGCIAGTFITPRVGAAAMSLVTARTEELYHVMAFCHDFVPVEVHHNTSLNSLLQQTDRLRFGGTDCALPMLYAMQHKIECDVFVVYTDNETWHGRIHPVQALQRYRQTMGIGAKLIVVGMVSNGFSIAHPDDGGMLDVVGFDSAAPSVMADFTR